MIKTVAVVLLVLSAGVFLVRLLISNDTERAGLADSGSNASIVTSKPVVNKSRQVAGQDKRTRQGKVSLSPAGQVALAKYELAVSPPANTVMLKQEEEARKRHFLMLSTVKAPGQLLDYLRKTGDFEGAVQKLAELRNKGQAREIEEMAKELSPDDSEDVIMFAGLALADIGTVKAVGSLFSIFEILPENSDLKRDVGEIIVTVTNTESKALLIDTMLSLKDQTMSDIAQRALANMADKDVIVSLFDGYLGSQNQRERELFADTLRHMRNPEIVPALKFIVEGEKNDSFDMIGQAACDTLGVIGTREATECLIRSLGQVSNESATEAVYAAIIKISNPESFDILLASAKDEDTTLKLRLASIAALKNYEYGLVGQTLREIVAGAKDNQVREVAASSLEKAFSGRSR